MFLTSKSLKALEPNNPIQTKNVSFHHLHIEFEDSTRYEKTIHFSKKLLVISFQIVWQLV